MATEKINLEIKVTGDAVKEVKNLKQQFTEAEDAVFALAGAGRQNTEEFRKASLEAAKLKQEVDNINLSLDTLKPEAKIAAIGTVVNGVAGGFAAATGAMALFGNESKEVEEALLKVQAALAIQQGIQSIVEVGKQFDSLKSILLKHPILIIGSVIAAIIGYFIGLDKILKVVTGAFSALGNAVTESFDFIVRGIGAAIGLATKFFDVITFGLFNANGAYKSYIKTIDDANKAEKEREEALLKEISALAGVIKELKAKAKLLDEEIKLVEKTRNAVQRRYDDEIAFAGAAGKETYAIEQEKLATLVESTKKQIELLRARFEVEKQLREANAELVRKIAGEEDLFAKALIDKQKNESVKANNERVSQIESLKEVLKNTERDITVNEISENKKRSDAYAQTLKEKEDAARRSAEELKKIQEQQSRELGEVQKMSSDADYEAYLMATKSKDDINKEYYASLYNATVKNSQDTIDTIDRDTALFKEGQELKVSMLSDSLGILSGLTELFASKNEKSAKRAFEINKAVSIAQALIQTYQGANSAFTSTAANPVSIANPALPFIAAGLAVAAGLSNVAKIAATKFQSGGGGAGGSTPSVPNFATPNSSGANSVDSTILNRQQIESGNHPTESRVYVVESDISQTQNRVLGIQNRARIV